ncbi:cupredoxin-like domain protein [Halobacteriovorax sp. BALOs_7]|nr:cupredoxin-like domain protein [Halobacteriovorax sp. BALOs_7]
MTLFALFLSIDSFGIEEDYFKKTSFDVPRRSISVIASEKGFYPENITAFVGERVSLFVTAATDRPSCFIMKEHDVYVEAKKGEVREATIFLDSPGRFKFYCPSGEISGSFTVIDHPKDQKKKKRDLASTRRDNVRVWQPKEE